MATDAKKPVMFDLSTVAAVDTTDVQLLHPTTGDEISASITVYGQDSAIYKSEQRKAEFKFSEYMRKHRNKAMPPEQREEMDRQKVINCVKSVNNLGMNGKAITDAEEALSHEWIYEQVTAAMFDRSLFIKG